MIGVVDYGTSNLNSLTNALKVIDAPFEVITDDYDFRKINRVIFPGIGSFDFCISSLKSKSWVEKLQNMVLKDQMPVLGICIGYQILFKHSSEGNLDGLCWIDGDINLISKTSADVKIPHMGWSAIKVKNSSRILSGVNGKEFFFLHSYTANIKNEYMVTANCKYGDQLNVAVEHKNLFGVQFHPEKSFSQGLKVLDNFRKI